MRGNSKLKFLILNLNFAFLILIFEFSSAHAWKLPIEVATVSEDGEKVYNKLVIGIESGAGDGFDNLWDAPAILSHPDPDNPVLLRAYITSTPSLNGGGEEEIKYLWKDIRGTKTNGADIWDIAVDSVPAGRTVVLSWAPPQGILKAGERLILKDYDRIDAEGEPAGTDVTQASGYSFVSAGTDVRSLSLVLSKDAVSSKRSGGGGMFGCGTIRPYSDVSSNGGAAAVSIVMLFIPLLVVRLLQRRNQQFSAKYQANMLTAGLENPAYRYRRDILVPYSQDR